MSSPRKSQSPINRGRPLLKLTFNLRNGTVQYTDTSQKASATLTTVDAPKRTPSMNYVEEKQPVPQFSTPAAKKTEVDRLVGGILGPDAYVLPRRSCVARQGAYAFLDEPSPTKKLKKSPARSKKKTPAPKNEGVAENPGRTPPKRSTAKQRRGKKKIWLENVLDDGVQNVDLGLEKVSVCDGAAAEMETEPVASVELGRPELNDAGAVNTKILNLGSIVQDSTKVVQNASNSDEIMPHELEIVSNNENTEAIQSEAPSVNEPPKAETVVDEKFEDSNEFSPEFGVSALSHFLSGQLTALQPLILQNQKIESSVPEVFSQENISEEEHRLPVPVSPEPKNKTEDELATFVPEESKENVTPFAVPFPPVGTSEKKNARRSASSNHSRPASRESSPFDPLPRHPVSMKLVPIARTHRPEVIQISRATFDSIRPRLPSLWSAAAPDDDSD